MTKNKNSCKNCRRKCSKKCTKKVTRSCEYPKCPCKQLQVLRAGDQAKYRYAGCNCITSSSCEVAVYDPFKLARNCYKPVHCPPLLCAAS